MRRAGQVGEMGFISAKYDQFTYFALQLGDDLWGGKDILDFGGNVGNLLKDPNSTVDAQRYWCLDVVEEAIEAGREAVPEAHWVHYDRYNFSFNPTGIPDLDIPELDQKFDYIVAYSVFTNTRRSTMIELVRQLEDRLKPGGTLAFTYIDPHFHSWPNTFNGSNFEWRLQQRTRPLEHNLYTELLDQASSARWFMLVNGRDLYYEHENLGDYDLAQRESCYTYYSTDYMQTVYPASTLLPPVNNEMQHCCVIKG